jgi:transposase
MAFIRRVKTSSGATAIQIAYKVYGKIVKIDHVGSAHTNKEISLLEKLAKQRLPEARQLALLPEVSQPETPVLLRQSCSKLLYDGLSLLYDELGFNSLDDEDFRRLCIARLVEPTSKLDSIRVLADLGVDGGSEDRLYRCLQRVIANKYQDKLAALCFAHASNRQGGITLVLYDVTTLYFEVQKADEPEGNNKGYRQSGMSKERRLEPQIVVGLLVDQNGFPLELSSFEGNKAETTTILPVVEAFKQKHNLTGITVVADAGMLSAKNLEDLTKAGYTYIVGSRLNKIPYAITEFQETKKKGEDVEFTDNQIITSRTAVEGQRIIYQYRAKRAALDLRNIEKQVEKAKKIAEGKTTAKKAKFLTVKTKEKGINQALVDKATALAGIKGYVTNLPTSGEGAVSDQQIINYYHQLWRVEQSFRMSKHDLRARPIFHHKREAIEAHLTVVLAALAIGRVIEERTGLGIKRLVKT